MNSITLSQIIDKSSQCLKPCSESFRIDAEVLISHALNFSRVQLYTQSNTILSEVEISRIDQLINRRRNGEPIAYIVGVQEFWSLDFKVTPDTLIPRPETERLVERALEIIPIDKIFRVLDLGTGAGVIAIAIASERPLCELLAVDKSAAALAVASENARALNISNIKFRQSDWFESIGNEKFDLLVSNPPYIESTDPHLSQGDVAREPRSALVSGVDGFDDIRHIIKCAKSYLCLSATLLVEHGWQQANKVQSIFNEETYRNVYSYKDLAGIERVTEGKYKNRYD